MNLGMIFGYLFLNVIFFLSVYLSMHGFGRIFDEHAIIMVCGGTIGVVIYSFSIGDIKKMLRDMKDAFFKNKIINKRRSIEDIVTLARAKRKSDSAFDAEVKKIREPFLRDAANALFWTTAEVSAEDFRELLETRASTYHNDSLQSPKIIKSITKYPPAFGLMGTIIGLIAMMAGLGDPNAKSQLGPAMAVALTATLYGLIINNLFLLPISENLIKQSQEQLEHYDLIIEGIMLIQAKRPTKYIEEKLLAFLPPDQKGR